jgi:hypothetical protein
MSHRRYDDIAFSFGSNAAAIVGGSQEGALWVQLNMTHINQSTT